MHVHLTVRIILRILTVLSFAPQVKRIRERRDCEGLDGRYLFINLVVATHQVALFIYFLTCPTEPGVVSSPPGIDGYFDLAQFCVVWSAQLLIFVYYGVFGPERRRAVKQSLILGYVAFVLVSFIPIIVIAVDKSGDTGTGLNRIYGHYQLGVLNPAVTFLATHAYFPQSSALATRTDPGALSVYGLAVQAAVFLILGLTWPQRMPAPQERGLWNWYRLGGWATVDSLVFAAVQGMLWWRARNLTGRIRLSEEEV